MRITIIGAAAAGLVLASCGGKLEEAAEAAKNVQSIASSADNVATSMDALTKRVEERRAKGDTVSMSYEELGKRLVDISGWTADAPTGESVDVPGMSSSTARRVYRQGDREMSVMLMDMNGAAGGYAGMTAMFAMKFKTDNSERTAETVQSQDNMVNGMLEFTKATKAVSGTWGAGGRFVLKIEINGGSSMDEVKTMAEAFGLSKLATL